MTLSAKQKAAEIQKQTLANLKPLDLSRKGALDKLVDLIKQDCCVGQRYAGAGEFRDYLSHGLLPALRHGRTPLFSIDDGHTVFAKDDIYYATPRFPMYEFSPSYIAGVAIQHKRTKKNKNSPVFLVLNGDTSEFPETNGRESFVDLGSHFHFPTISFDCLASLMTYDPAKPVMFSDAAKALATGRIVLLDFQGDSRKYLTTEEHQTLNANGPGALTAPELGYTLIGGGSSLNRSYVWHRSGLVFLKDKDRKAYYILGQDDEQYFGCQFPKGFTGTTIKQAVKGLMPTRLHKLGGSVRQGEWFISPVDEKDVPEKSECVLLFDPSYESVWLPTETDESAKHFIESGADGRVGRDGRVYVLNPSLRHENGDHGDRTMHGWATFDKNTAVRSVSIKGVD